MNNDVKKSKGQELYIDARVAVVIAVTFILFLVAVITMTVSLVMDMTDDGGYVSVDDGDGDVKTPTKKPQDTGKTDTPVSGTPKPGYKTGMVLPALTPADAVKSTPAAELTDLAEDTGIKSAHAVLVKLGDNSSIAEKGADTKVYPASMTKVMTLLVACENARDPNALLTVTQEMVDYHKDTGGSGMMGFSAGESITVEDALYLVIYDSDTIACLLLAQYVAGSEQAFVGMMNDKAAALGLTGTHFVNCTGLFDEEHYTTCREMAAIMACALKNAVAKEIITSYNGYTVDIYQGDNRNNSRSSLAYADWYSTRLGDNPWAGNGSDVKILGGKTGYEDIPRYCFVTYAKNTETGTEYICVTVGRSSNEQYKISLAESTNDTKRIYQKYATK